MKIIVGLGNPGKEYAKTRHNVGFMVVDHLAEKLGAKGFKEKFRAQVAEVQLGREKVLLVKPQTYMNASGEAVLELIRYFKAGPEDILVIYDDMDLPPGSLRIRKKGSSGGHNGMKSIIYLLQQDEFVRLRVGIGQPTYDSVKYVLGNFTPEEEKTITEAVQRAAVAVETVITEGVDKAMNLYNEKTGTKTGK